MKKKLLIFPLLLNSMLIFGQRSNEVIPPAPVSREFAKYIDQEVSLYNGIPEINIPLYTIQVRGLTIPISLSYHASGIKFAQESGDVGLGWILNPGYRVSRSVHGTADELSTMPANLSSVISNYETNAVSGIQGKIDRDLYLAKFVRNSEFNPGFNFDGEYDQFTFSTPTSGGGFIITDRSNKTIATTEDSNVKIDYKVGGSICPLIDGIKGFQVIDEKGNNFTFGEYNAQTQCSLETASGDYAGLLATAWGISDVVTPTGDAVNFSYTRRTAGEFTTHIRSWSIRETAPQNHIGSCDVETVANEQISTGHFYNSFVPNTILSPNEQVVFNYNVGGLFPNKLSKIQVKTLSGDILRTIDFFYSHGPYIPGSATHVFLDSITIKDKGQTTIETYRFEYYDKNVSRTYTIDHYGNYLPGPTEVFYHQQFLDDPILLTTPNQYNAYYCNSQLGTDVISYFLSGLGISRDPSPSLAPNYFSLKKIVYPTGGYTEYEYENGKYRDVGDSWPIRNAGIRIKSIKSFDLITQEPIVKHYTYGNNENGYGYPQFWVLNLENLFVREGVGYYSSPTDVKRLHRTITYSTTMQGDVATVFTQSGYVKYPCVTEYYTYSPIKNGKTVYYFDIGNEYEIAPLTTQCYVPRQHYISGTPNYIRRYRLFDKPLLSRKVVFSGSSGQYTPVQEEIFDYDQSFTTYAGVKIEQSVMSGTTVLNNESYGIPVWDEELDRYFNYGDYFIEVGRNVLTNKTLHDYSNGSTKTTNYTYGYSNLLPSKETVTQSTGGSLVTHTSYPKDYPTGTGFIDNMVSGNLVAYPIEEVTYREEGASKEIVSGSITKYKTGGKGLVDEVLTLENSSSIALSAFKFSNRPLGVLPPQGSPSAFSLDNNYKAQAYFNAYDIHGNILRITKKDDLSKSYVWGYNKLYPIAEVINATETQIYHTSFEETGTVGISRTGKKYFNGPSYPIPVAERPTGTNLKMTFWFYTSAGGWQFQPEMAYSSTVTKSGATRLDEIRVYPVGSQMATYTYDPPTGMTSMTDTNNTTTYYSYDPYGRLELIKDDKGNILKAYQYHFKGQ